MKKTRIKSIFYNNCPDLMLFLIVLSVLAIAVFVSLGNWGILLEFLCIAILFFVWLYKGNKANENLSYFKCSYSLLAPNCVWINQKIRMNRNQDKCPQLEFVKELDVILKVIPEGTICYCCTHDLIKEHILKRYPDARTTEMYEKDLLRLKKKMKTMRCNQCKAKKCTLLKHEKTQFYAISFIK